MTAVSRLENIIDVLTHCTVFMILDRAKIFSNGTNIMDRSGISVSFRVSVLEIGKSAGSYAVGFFGSSTVFKRALTDAEVVQHFQESPNFAQPIC